jgi:hypothetical protein
MEHIRPALRDKFGNTIYPTGNEWILAFALNGCEWARNIVRQQTSTEIEENIRKEKQ